MRNPKKQPLKRSSQPSKKIDDSVLIPLLARRSHHLPGNDWRQDWNMWMSNNHIIFGICLHHRLHPVETWERLLMLLSSVSFGLVATGAVYQLYEMYPESLNAALVQIRGTPVTSSMVVLWTAGGLLHGVFDTAVWHIMACACCHPGGRFGDHKQSRRFKDCGSYLLIPVIVGLLGLAAYLVLQQAASGGTDNNDDDDDSATDDEVDFNDIQGPESFRFLTKYCVELFMAWFVYFPVVGTLLFSGVLGCNGRLPFLGGRPRDMMLISQEGSSLTSDSNYPII